MSWLEVQVKTTQEAVDAVSNILYEAGAGGVVIKDAISESDICKWDYINLKDIPQDNTAIVIGYLPESPDLPDKISVIKSNLKGLKEYIDAGDVSVTLNEVNEEDWANSWKKYYKPIKICGRIVVKPQWEEYAKGPDDIVIELDPGMAFGTGTHETTVMCIKMLNEYVKSEMSVIDVGCGSGILSIVSAKLGAKEVLALDIDDVAVNVAKENVAKNGVDDKIRVEKSDGISSADISADIIVANIIADIIIKIIPDVKDKLKPEGVFIASGIIKEREEDVKNKLEMNGFDIKSVMYKGEWVALSCVANV